MGLTVGDTFAEATIDITRDTLVRYAGASGDFNPIHYNDDVARSVGLDSVIAHGMLTMGAVIGPVIERLGDPGRVLSYETRFSAPVAVPAMGTATLVMKAVVAAIDEEHARARLDLTVTHEGTRVLTKARVQVNIA